jgi:hypothetical protein
MWQNNVSFEYNAIPDDDLYEPELTPYLRCIKTAKYCSFLWVLMGLSFLFAHILLTNPNAFFPTFLAHNSTSS